MEISDKFETRRLRLLQIKDEQCGGVTSALAKRIGRDMSYVSRMLYPEGKAGKKRIAEDMVELIEKSFGLPNGWLSGTPDQVISVMGIPPLNKQKKDGIPLISNVPAGNWKEAIDNLQPGDAEQWLPVFPGCGRGTFALRVQGDSMTSQYPGQRSYPHGTIIYVDPTKDAVPGKAVVVRLPGSNEVTFKLLASDAGIRYLKPINPQYQMIQFDEAATICGVVVWSCMPE